MDFDEWKLHLAAALERECWWDPGQGIEYVKETGEEDWRQLRVFRRTSPRSRSARRSWPRLKRTVTETKKWIDEFEKRAGPLLREIFEKDLGTTPPKLIERIEMLRKTEKKLLSGKLK
jgi:hypothetical protein